MTTTLNNTKLTPGYIVGFTDAEGMFGLIVGQCNVKLNIRKLSLEFKITQKMESLKVLQDIQKFFNCGRIAVDNAQ